MKPLNIFKKLLPLIILCLILSGCSYFTHQSASIGSIPEFSGIAYIEIDGNTPDFEKEDLTLRNYEYYSELDFWDRCGYAFAIVGTDTMPTAERGEIGQVKPSGWKTVKYDFIDGKYLYNRCHLIGYQLTGENANERNLITGTRYMNVQGMLPFENMVAEYVKETSNHVAYSVTPIFDKLNLVASGVQIQAYSIEDNGQGICFNVYCYNVQPGVRIDYATGESQADENAGQVSIENAEYILNTNSKKFHKKSCDSVSSIKEENRGYGQNRELLISLGYSPCGSCKP